MDTHENIHSSLCRYRRQRHSNNDSLILLHFVCCDLSETITHNSESRKHLSMYLVYNLSALKFTEKVCKTLSLNSATFCRKFFLTRSSSIDLALIEQRWIFNCSVVTRLLETLVRIMFRAPYLLYF